MNKRVVMLIVGVLLFSLISLSADVGINALTPDDIDWTGSSSLYEFADKVVRIDFLKSGQSKILEANITVNGSTINSIVQPAVCGFTGNLITCTDDFDILRVNITGQEVDADSSFDWSIAAIDNESGLVTKTLSLTVLNDSLPPRYVLNSPLDSSIVRNISTLFNMTVTEEESGLDSVRMSYDYYNLVAESSATNSNTLTCDSDCITSVSLNPPTGQYYFGYFFNLSDNAGNVNMSQYFWLFVDTEEPTVTLTSPADNVNISASSQDYGFNVGDNAFGIDARFSPTVNCSVYIDSTFKNSTVRSSNSSVSLGAFLGDVTDGYHNWSVTCVDTAGFSTTSSSRNFLLDTTGPSITLNTPAENTPVVNGTTIDLSVADTFSSVDSVWYSLNGDPDTPLAGLYDIDTSSWNSGNNTLVVSANDSLGNPSNVSFTFIIDSTGPGIELLSPADGAFNNNIFMVNATDDYSSTLSCDLFTDGTFNENKNTSNGILLTYTPTLAEGAHNWSVSCTDEVGNTNVSETRAVTIDTTNPVVTLLSPANGSNTNGTLVNNYSVVDANLDVCSLYIDNVIAVTNNLTSSNDPHTWYVSCNDSAGNIGDSSEWDVYNDDIFPTLSNITNGSISSNSAIIFWDVDENTDNTVYYGTNSSDLSLSINGGFSVSPGITLNSLDTSTTYFYLASSCDQFDQCSNSSIENFTTSPESGGPSSSSGGGGSGSGRKQCSDNKDNDGDGLIDLADPGCDSRNDNDETNSLTSSSCMERWVCNDWSECVDGTQTRTCQDWNVCGTGVGKPEETQSCEVEDTTSGDVADVDTNTEEDVTDTETAPGVGQAIGLFDGIKKNGKAIAAAAGILALLGLVGWKRKSIGSAIGKIRNYKTAKTLKEEEMIRERLRKEGLI